jgi:hypothetical protein
MLLTRIPTRSRGAVVPLLRRAVWADAMSGGLTFLNEQGSDYLGLPKDLTIVEFQPATFNIEKPNLN